MSTTVTMWLGVAFVALAATAILLQAWLWGIPPKGDKLRTVRFWTQVHRAVGIAYAAVYLVMMSVMVPRLWEYQLELPARTVVHACVALTIGVLLIAKVAVIRFFPHFTDALPKFGLAILVCTVLLASLSLPFAIRAHTWGGRTLEAANLERTKRILTGLDHLDAAALATPAALRAGRAVLTRKCVACHDLRTVLVKPRTGRQWYATVRRMAERPTIWEPITAEDIPRVLAYLVAVTPDLQQSRRLQTEQEEVRAERRAEVASLAPPGPQEEAPVDPATLRSIFENRCSQCHETTQVDAYGRHDAAGWTSLVKRMVEEEGAELAPGEAPQIIRFLTASRGL